MTTRHSHEVITYQGPYGGGHDHDRLTLCLACADREGVDHGGYTVHYGLHRGVCDRDPAEAQRIADYAIERAQIDRDQAAGYDR